MKYRDENGVFQDLYLPPTGDTLPIGSEVDYNGETVPYGWEEVTDPNSYSTTEVKTNKTWIDGKPIYRKVIIQNNLTLSSNGALVGNIGSNVSTWISSYHRVGNSDGNGVRSGRTGYLNSNYYSGIQLSINGDIRLYAKEDAATKVYCLVIMEYTKTTD